MNKYLDINQLKHMSLIYGHNLWQDIKRIKTEANPNTTCI